MRKRRLKQQGIWLRAGFGGGGFLWDWGEEVFFFFFFLDLSGLLVWLLSMFISYYLPAAVQHKIRDTLLVGR